MQKPSLLTLLAMMVFLIGFGLLFIPWHDTYYPRSLKILWNLGHFPLFACGTLLALHYCKPLTFQRYEIQLVITIIVATMVGLAIEYLQIRLGRSFSLMDVVIDLAGAFFAIAWFSQARSLLHEGVRLCSRGLSILLIILGLWPLTLALVDEFSAWRQFPKLAEFKSTLELERFGGTASFELLDNVMQVKFGTIEFSGVALNHFPRDWRAYQTLHLQVENPEQKPLKIICRIHDTQHNNEYIDRYKKTFTILPGSQQIDIPLSDVKNGPKFRQLHMDSIGQLACFTHRLSEPATLLVHRLYLD